MLQKAMLGLPLLICSGLVARVASRIYDMVACDMVVSGNWEGAMLMGRVRAVPDPTRLYQAAANTIGHVTGTHSMICHANVHAII